ncbi:MAG: hypothetical protein ACRCTJ_02740 [Brevinema sp.]
MKKILILLYLINLTQITFGTENSKFNRFGMGILSGGVGLGLHVNIFPLSFYIANEKNQIISFGVDFNFSVANQAILINKIISTQSFNSDVASISYDKIEAMTSSFSQKTSSTILQSFGIGAHIGYGKLFPSKNHTTLHYGYLFDFSTGYTKNAVHNLPFYIGFSPQFILEIDMFLFSIGVYADTSLTITTTMTIGFLLK